MVRGEDEQLRAMAMPLVAQSRARTGAEPRRDGLVDIAQAEDRGEREVARDGAEREDGGGYKHGPAQGEDDPEEGGDASGALDEGQDLEPRGLCRYNFSSRRSTWTG